MKSVLSELEDHWCSHILSFRLEALARPIDAKLWEELREFVFVNSISSENGFAMLNLVSLLLLLLQERGDEELQKVLDTLTVHPSKEIAEKAILARYSLKLSGDGWKEQVARDISSSVESYRSGMSN